MISTTRTSSGNTNNTSFPAKLLNNQEALSILEILYKVNISDSLTSFVNVMKSLKKIIPYEKSISILANIDSNGRLISYQTINISYPESWVKRYQKSNYENIDPVVRKNFRTFNLFHWQDLKSSLKEDRFFWSLADDFRLTQGCTYGLPNRHKTMGSLFSFSGTSLKHPRHEAVLHILVPQLDIKFREVMAYKKSKNIHLTSREVEVLQWVKEGKSNWDIAAILCISERTVKFHISSILKKLDVVNRSQAIAVAVSENIIEL